MTDNEDKLFSEDGECYEDEVTCPKCGHEHCDSWEYQDSDDDMTCDKCGARFSMERDTTVKYTTRLLECNDGNGCPADAVQYDHRMRDSSDADYTGKSIRFVDKPKEKWALLDIWNCTKCGKSHLIRHPYTEAEDPMINLGLHDKPMAPYTTKEVNHG